MTPAPYTEDTLVQQTTAEYLEQELGWRSVYAYNSEDFGPDSLLGRTSDRERSGLDAQIWPLIALHDPPRDWRRVFAFIDHAHRAGEGYGFNRDPDGLWTEGTAQAAAVARLSGLKDKAQPLWSVLLAQEAGNGWLYATPAPRISTGLAIGPDSVTNDFFYYHLPHLGATAWAAIAATGVNPFTGSQEAD